MLIDKSYFIGGEIQVAGLGTTAVQDSLNIFIAKREPEYLEAALGYAFNKLFQAAIEDEDGKWYELKTGAEYVNADGKTKKWTGLINAAKLSPIANYCYYWLQRDGISFTATVGEMEGKSDNAKPVSPRFKMCRAWNEMADQTRLLHDFLLNKKDEAGEYVYPEFRDNYDEVSSNQIVEKMNPLGI